MPPSGKAVRVGKLKAIQLKTIHFPISTKDFTNICMTKGQAVTVPLWEVASSGNHSLKFCNLSVLLKSKQLLI